MREPTGISPLIQVRAAPSFAPCLPLARMPSFLCGQIFSHPPLADYQGALFSNQIPDFRTAHAQFARPQQRRSSFDPAQRHNHCNATSALHFRRLAVDCRHRFRTGLPFLLPSTPARLPHSFRRPSGWLIPAHITRLSHDRYGPFWRSLISLRSFRPASSPRSPDQWTPAGSPSTGLPMSSLAHDNRFFADSGRSWLCAPWIAIAAGRFEPRMRTTPARHPVPKTVFANDEEDLLIHAEWAVS